METIRNIVLCTTFLLLAISSDQAQQAQLVVQTGHSASVNSLAFSPDGRLLASGGADQAIKLWEVKTGHELRSLFGHTKEIICGLQSRWQDPGKQRR